jgi:hypothetical protein
VRDHRPFDRLSSRGEPRRRRSETPDVCDRAGNCGVNPEFNIAKPLIAAEHLINISNPNLHDNGRQFPSVAKLNLSISTVFRSLVRWNICLFNFVRMIFIGPFD